MYKIVILQLASCWALSSSADDTSKNMDAIYKKFESAVASNGTKLVKKVKGVICFNVGGTKFTLDLKNGSGAVSKGKTGKVDLTLTVKEKDFLDMASGKLNGQQAFMTGKLKIKVGAIWVLFVHTMSL